MIRDGGIIKEGYHEEVDRLRKAKTEGKQLACTSWRPESGKRQASKTCGSNTIRSSVIIWRSPIPTKIMVPDYYMRKQTLTNAERYITPELKELEDMILGAEDKLFSHGI